MEGMYTAHIIAYDIYINISTDTKICQGALSLTENFSGRRHLPPSGTDVVIRILALCRQGSHILPSCAFAAIFTHYPLTPTFSISFNTPFKPKKLEFIDKLSSLIWRNNTAAPFPKRSGCRSVNTLPRTLNLISGVSLAGLAVHSTGTSLNP